MRIAHVTDCYLPRLGGIERQVHDLAQRQALAGDEVEIITSVASADGHEDALLVHRPPPRSGRADRPGAISYLASEDGRRQVVGGGYDVVHVHASTFSPLCYLAAQSASATGIPTVITAHSLWSWATPIFQIADLALRWRDWPLAWSAVSTVAAGSLQRTLGPDVPVTLLPNGIDVQAWRVPATVPERNRVVIVSVMRLARRKRPRHFVEMLRAARRLVPDGIELEAIVIGDGPLRTAVQRLIDNHRMASWVRITGQLDAAAIRQIYRRADIYVAPATLESFGIAALEARCAGLPVIAHEGTGVTDFITHGQHGLLARGDRHMALLIAELATNRAMIEHMRAHNLHTLPPVSWDAVSSQCERLYARARMLAEGQQGERAMVEMGRT